MGSRRMIADEQRRARLVARHHLARRAPDVQTAVGDLVVVHSSDPATPYLALRARVERFAVDDLDHALYEQRTLRRLHAMRRTLFVTAATDAPMLQAACADDVARAERRKLEGWVSTAVDGDAQGWLADVERRTLAVLSDGTPRLTRELATLVEGLDTRITVGSGRWTSAVALSSRLLLVLALEGRLVRAAPAGSWLSSQYRWADVQAWFAGPVPPRDPALARGELTQAYLRAHGPATTTDLRWWAGWTARATAQALADAAAVEVDLNGGATGWVLPDDLGEVPPPPPSVALLPALDPTTMGFKERRWYLGELAPRLFDRNGNAGPTTWVDGRIVGGWGQRPDGEVVVRLLIDVGRDGAEAVAAEAAALTAWLDGVVVTPRFRTPLERVLSA